VIETVIIAALPKEDRKKEVDLEIVETVIGTKETVKRIEIVDLGKQLLSFIIFKSVYVIIFDL
jgi:hypothetical protein